jgi:erythromycin esterase
MLSLIAWLREFNADRPLENRVRFHGVDPQYAMGPAEAIREFLWEVDPYYLAEIAAVARKIFESLE